VETEKLGRVKKVIAHNDGEVVEEVAVGNDVRVKVMKSSAP
jgi:hypothetical protein